MSTDVTEDSDRVISIIPLPRRIQDASRQLDEARHEKNYTSPCMRDPGAWDVEYAAVDGSPSYYPSRIPARICAKECAVLVECARLRNEVIRHPTKKIFGVIAGWLITGSGSVVDYDMLQRSQKPKERRKKGKSSETEAG